MDIPASRALTTIPSRAITIYDEDQPRGAQAIMQAVFRRRNLPGPGMPIGGTSTGSMLDVWLQDPALTFRFRQRVEALGIDLARAAETQIARSIANGTWVGKSWWPNLAPSTIKKNERANLPTIPLLGSGKMVKALEDHEMPVSVTWHEDTLEVSFGFDPEHTTGKPSSRAQEQDSFFGNTGTGKDGKTVIPSRYPRLDETFIESMKLAMQNWAQASPQQATNQATGGDDDYLSIMKPIGGDFLED